MRLMIGAVLAIMAFSAQAEVQSRPINYGHEGSKLTGYLYWDDALSGKRPGVMVVHEWWGLNDYAKSRARQLAELGYVAFAADMYGEGKVTAHGKDAKEWMSQITANVGQWQQRALAGLDQLKAQPEVDNSKLAAIGYCFGGATVMQMAYSSSDLLGVVSFHGSLPPAPASAKGNISAKILAAHGGQDQFTSMEKVNAFEQSLIDAGADWELDIYGNARHAFTNPDAGSYGIDNLRYDAEADKRSWQRMKEFLAGLFGE